MPRTLLAVACLVAFSGCDGFSDFVADPMGDFAVQIRLPDAPVALGPGVIVEVAPGRAMAVTADVEPDVDVQDLIALESIRIDPSFFQFTPMASATAAAAPSGVLSVSGFINGYVVPGSPVEVVVTDGVVTQVNPDLLSEASALDMESALAYAEEFEIDVPEGLAEMTGQELIDGIAEGIESARAAVTLVVEVVDAGDPNNPLQGTISLDQLEIGATVTP